MNSSNRYAIFYNDGTVRTIEAYNFEWDTEEELLSFLDDDEYAIACFKLDRIEGVALVSDTSIGMEETIKQISPVYPSVIYPWRAPDMPWIGPQITCANNTDLGVAAADFVNRSE